MPNRWTDDGLYANFIDVGGEGVNRGRMKKKQKKARQEECFSHKRLNFLLKAFSTTSGTHALTDPPKLATSFIVLELTKK